MVESVSISPNLGTVPIGIQYALRAEAFYTDKTTRPLSNPTWSSSNPEIARVSSTGRLFPYKAGSVNITVSGPEGRTATLNLDVSGAVLEELTISPDPLNLSVGLQTALAAQGRFSDGSIMDLTEQVFWTSDEVNTVSVTDIGIAEGRKKGFTVILATAPNLSLIHI